MRNLLLIPAAIISLHISAQKNNEIISGPMIGHTELRSTTIWIETTTPTGFSVNYSAAAPGIKNSKRVTNPITIPTNDHFILKFVLANLEPGAPYQYDILSKNNSIAKGKFNTQQLWQWRKPAPDFSFITGSCAYFNQPVYDRPGQPYGGDSSIFETMAKEKADFMLWLGDNWYTRETDFFSEWGLNYRPSRDRSLKVLQPFWKAMPHYAIWDDHDYSWDNGDRSYPLKEASRNVFMKFWCNPSLGENGKGVYTKITWNDVDIFLLDDRWFRSNDHMMDTINGQPNPEKKMFGEQQIEWLKNALLGSNENTNISFRIIATGSQVLNSMSPADCFRHFSAEYNELMNFIKNNQINGIIFLTGDRHHSEIIKTDRQGTYPLHDITSSPLTSGVHKTSDNEKNNPHRIIPEIDEQNYTRISFSGEKQDRKMTVEFLGIKGQKLGEWNVVLKNISSKQ
jgi:alkaline phosphatase D